MKKMIISILFALSAIAEAQGKALISLTPNCPDDSDLRIYEFPVFTEGVRIHSAEAEWEIILKATKCGIYIGDQGFCRYTQAASGSYNANQDPITAALYSSGYDLGFNGEFYLKLLDGRSCRYEISED